MTARVVIVGAGHAGGTAAAQLRHLGFSGSITLVGEEAIVPYQRPPLSKAYLLGESEPEALKLRADHVYDELQITLRLGEPARAIDPAGKRVVLRSGATESYDKLILATGSVNRRLHVRGSELAGIFALRNVGDADAIRAAIRPGEVMAVIGGGYIGLEVAASARKLGMDVVVVERERRVLARIASETLSTFFSHLHVGRGVRIVTGAEVTAFEGDSDGFVKAITLADGTSIACSIAIVGVGAQSCDSIAAEAGLLCDGGVIVDAAAQTSDPDIFAIGDMTMRPLPLYEGRTARLESVQNAVEQARQAACAILERPPPAPEVPWFWSDQFDVKLQIAGLGFDVDRSITRGNPEANQFSIFHLRSNRVRAVEAVNTPQDFMGGRMLIQKGTAVDPGQLRDVSVPIRAIANAA